MATIVTLGQQFFDAIGEPLAGGTLSFYTHGTLVLKNVFTDQTGITPLSNPLTLTSEGRLPSASVWGEGSYRIILKDSDGVVIFDIDTVNLFDPFDWTGLTASVADLNAVAGALGTPGTVVANKAVVVDGSKNIATFGTLSGSILKANTALQGPQINDANGIAAITIPGVPSQVNSITVTPTVTTVSPSIMATGGDSNIDLLLAGKGTGGVKLSGLLYPKADGTSGQVITTNGSGTLTLASIPTSSQVVKQVVTASSTTFSTITALIPADDTIPQITEGTEILTCTITPTSASSTLYIQASVQVNGSVSMDIAAALFRDAGANAIITGSSTATLQNITFTASTPSTAASSTTFRLRVGGSTAGSVYINGLSGARLYGGTQTTTLLITEV